MGVMRNRSGLKETWSRALARLVLPTSPWTVEHLLRAYVEQIRGRELVLSRNPDVASPGGPSGLWFPGPKADHVWAHPTATGVQYDHILGHELGHMVNGDEPDPLDLTGLMRLLYGTYSQSTSGLWKSALAGVGVACRADGTSAEGRERRAEDFGYFAERWVASNSPRAATLLEANMRESLDT
jgi:hypothetical protein